MNKQFLTIVSLLLFVSLGAQSLKNATKYAKTITEKDLKDLLTVYASDDFQGRETSSLGEQKAHDFIVGFYKERGIMAKNGNYFQAVPLTKKERPNGKITIQNKTFRIGEDAIIEDIKALPPQILDLVDIGYGIDADKYSDYQKAFDYKGRTALLISGEPIDDQGNYVLTGSKDKSSWSLDPKMKFELIRSKGLETIFYFDPVMYPQYKNYIKMTGSNTFSLKSEQEEEVKSPNVIFINKAMYDLLKSNFDEDRHDVTLAKPIKIDAKQDADDTSAKNVIAYIEGSEYPNEYIVISAHLDHLGINDKGEINNGADDDGSGTVAVLEIAEAFKNAENKGLKPKRSIVFLHATGEEKGLLGSQYYTENPIFPLENTMTNLNIDMVGRVDPLRKGDRNYIYLIGSDKLSEDLHLLSEQTNTECCQIQLDYTFNDENDSNRFYYRSDHYNFAKYGIPIIFYFNGVHDDYHKPTDTVEKIEFDLLENRTRLIFHTAWNLANRTQPLVRD